MRTITLFSPLLMAALTINIATAQVGHELSADTKQPGLTPSKEGNKNSAPSLREWRVEDSVRVRYLYDTAGSRASPWSNSIRGARAEDFIQVAPGGEYFFFGTRRGDLSCDCARYTLSVYSVAQVRKAMLSGRGVSAGLPPLHTVEMTSAFSMDFAAIRYAAWESASTIRFMGYSAEGNTGLYRLDARSGVLRQLMEARTGTRVLENDFALQGDTVAYRAHRTLDARPLVRHYPSWALHASARDFLSGEIRDRMEVEVFTRAGSELARRVTSFEKHFLVPFRSSMTEQLSPDGRWLVVSVPATDLAGQGEVIALPSGWERYDGLGQSGGRSSADEQRLWRYLLVDIRSGTTRPMMDAPLGPLNMATAAGTPQLFWSADSAHVVLVNVSLPLDGKDVQRRSMGYLVDYDVRAGKWSALQAMAEDPAVGGSSTSVSTGTVGAAARRVRGVGWHSEGRALSVTHVGADGRPAGTTVYTLGDDGWRVRPAQVTAEVISKSGDESPQLAGGLKVVLRESEDEPVALIAVDGRREIPLLTPDPALEGIWRAPVQVVNWVERNGFVKQGWLLLPRGVRGAKPLPLVVQLEPPTRGEFRPDGAGSTAYAAQALVAQGMAVLRINHGSLNDHYPELSRPQRRGAERTPTDPAWLQPLLERERIDAAVAKVVEEGLVDPERVGLIGFSRTGFYVHYLITHPAGVKPAAAIVADSTTSSYGEYILNQGLPDTGIRPVGTASAIDFLYGGTFWQNKQTWVEQAPLFNVEQVETPVLFTFHGVGAIPVVMSAPVILETIAAYRMNGREFDYHLFPEGTHQLQRPQERLASLQLTVDWMNFWLQGRESADPQRAEQTRFWTSLRAHREARQAREKAQSQAPPHRVPPG